MRKQERDEQVNRRGFLRAVAATATVATLTGAGAALLRRQETDTAVTVMNAEHSAVSPSSVPISNNSQTATAEIADLHAQLATVKAENTRLRAELATTRQQISGQQQSETAANAATETLTAELESAHAQIGVLSGLVALYEQLDNVDLGELVDGGLNTLSDSLAKLMAEAPQLSDGITVSRMALDQFEAEIPLVENGRLWLHKQTEQLGSYYEAARTVLETTVERVGHFLDMLDDWFADIRKWLPFGLGQRATEVMGMLSILLAEVPHTLSGLNTNVVQPLDVWLASAEGEDAPLKQRVVVPVREKVLDKGETVVARAQQVQTTYETDVAEPVKTAVEQRRVLRQQIAAYREQHGI